MPVALPVGFAQVAFHHSGGSVTGDMVNTQAFDLRSMTPATVQDSLNLISQAWATNVNRQRTAAITYEGCSAIFNDDVLGKVALESTTGTAVGQKGSLQMMPLSVAFIVHKRTSFAGRKFAGRMFIGGFPVNVMDDDNPNILSDASVGEMQPFFTTFLTTCENAGCLLVLLHQEGTPIANIPTPINALEVHPLVATLRKRIR